ncbi:MAG: hypothetical protein AB1758_24035, partial [Candidatus Eremiobacterota bacterium]
NSDIKLPDYLTALKTAFQWTGNPQAASLQRKGIAWAKGSIFTRDNTDLGDPAEVTNKFAVEDNAKGNLAPKARTGNVMYDLNVSDFKVLDGSVPEVPIMAGTYVFGTCDYTVNFDAEFRTRRGTFYVPQPPETVSVPVLILRDPNGVDRQAWVLGSAVPSGTYTSPRTGYSGTITASTPPYPVTQDADGRLNLQDIATGPVPATLINKVDIDITTADFRVKSGVVLSSDANFGVVSQIGTTPGPGQLRETDAKLYLATNGTAVDPNPAAIKAATSVDVREVYGNGALVAGNGDVTLRASGTLNNDPDSGLALYASRDVILDSNLLTATEVTAGQTNVTSTFKGLVYAQRDFLIKPPPGTPPGLPSLQSDLTIQGALVARDGKIEIQDSKNVKLLYDPAYLKKILKDRPNGDIRLERMCFNLK